MASVFTGDDLGFLCFLAAFLVEVVATSGTGGATKGIVHVSVDFEAQVSAGTAVGESVFAVAQYAKKREIKAKRFISSLDYSVGEKNSNRSVGDV